MMSMHRYIVAAKAAGVHLLCSGLVALLAGVMVFALWYPFPYDQLSGGRELFFLVVAADVICGPLLTFVIFNPSKPRGELVRDLGLVAAIQLVVLGYGLWTVMAARPLFLVHEVDRFRVIAAPEIDAAALAALPPDLRPSWWSKPVTASLREPKDENERRTVLLDAIEGGRDYAERPEFYAPYNTENSLKSLKRAKPLVVFLEKRPDQKDAAQQLASKLKADISQWMYLPVVARQNWVAVLDKQGQIQGFLKGDGF